MEKILENILEILWNSSTWGKVVVVIVLAAGVVALIVHERNQAKSRKLGKDLRALARQWPFLSPWAIEFRARAFSEAFFNGWNGLNLSGIEAHATADLVRCQQALLRDAIASRAYTPFTIKGFTIPQWRWVQLPDRDIPAMVTMRLAVHVHKLASVGEEPYLLTLEYGPDGRWRVCWMEFGEAEFKDFPASNLDTSRIAEAQLAEPAEETLNPVREIARGARPGRLLPLTLLFPLGFLAFIIWLHALEYRFYDRAETLRKDGARILAPVTALVTQEDKYFLDYLLFPPGASHGYEFHKGSFLLGTLADVRLEDAKETVDRGLIEVVYDPANPSRNCPLHLCPNDQGDFVSRLIFLPLLGVALVVLCLRWIIAKYQSGNNHFWLHWRGPPASSKGRSRPLSSGAPASVPPPDVESKPVYTTGRSRLEPSMILIGLIMIGLGTWVFLAWKPQFPPRDSLTVMTIQGALPKGKDGGDDTFTLPDGKELSVPSDEMGGRGLHIATSLRNARSTKEIRLVANSADAAHPYGNIYEVSETRDDGLSWVVCSYEQGIRTHFVGNLGFTFIALLLIMPGAIILLAGIFAPSGSAE